MNTNNPKQQQLFENESNVNQHVALRPCHYCNGTDLVITEDKYDGHTFYHIHHSDYDLGRSKRKCGLLIYDWDISNMIKRYNQDLNNESN